MNMALSIIEPAVLDKTERAELDANIDALIKTHKNNRQEINRLVFESVAAMTAGEDYERQLTNKKGLRRFLGGITGSSKRLQDQINSSRAAAQYAAQQTLQRLAEQNLMSFDLIAAVNNKLNASVTGIESEINEIYGALTMFFKQSKSDIIRMETRVERLERNVNLLNWQNAIEYQLFNGTEYAELDDITKIVCLTRDFYEITKGEWTTADLLLLKTAMGTIGLPLRGSISYYDFIRRVADEKALSDYLLNGNQMEGIPEPYLVPLLGMKKLELLETEDRYIVDTVAQQLEEVDRREVQALVVRQYLRQEARVDINTQVNPYDLIMELLLNLRAVEQPDTVQSAGQPDNVRAVPDKAPAETGREPEKSEKANTSPTDPEELYVMAKRYEKGTGVSKDLNKAIHYYTLAAEHKDVQAQYDLAMHYEHGTGIEKNRDKALKLFLEAAEQGYVKAQYKAGIYYEEAFEKKKSCPIEGSAVRFDVNSPEFSWPWERWNSLFAQHSAVGDISDDPRDLLLEKAIYWYRKAAEQGHARAKERLDRLDSPVMYL